MAERIKRVKEEIVGVLSVLGSIYLPMSLLLALCQRPCSFFQIHRTS